MGLANGTSRVAIAASSQVLGMFGRKLPSGFSLWVPGVRADRPPTTQTPTVRATMCILRMENSHQRLQKPLTITIGPTTQWPVASLHVASFFPAEKVLYSACREPATVEKGRKWSPAVRFGVFEADL